MLYTSLHSYSHSLPLSQTQFREGKRWTCLMNEPREICFVSRFLSLFVSTPGAPLMSVPLAGARWLAINIPPSGRYRGGERMSLRQAYICLRIHALLLVSSTAHTQLHVHGEGGVANATRLVSVHRWTSYLWHHFHMFPVKAYNMPQMAAMSNSCFLVTWNVQVHAVLARDRFQNSIAQTSEANSSRSQSAAAPRRSPPIT